MRTIFTATQIHNYSKLIFSENQITYRKSREFRNYFNSRDLNFCPGFSVSRDESPTSAKVRYLIGILTALRRSEVISDRFLLLLSICILCTVSCYYCPGTYTSRQLCNKTHTAFMLHIYIYMMKVFLFKSNQYLFHYLITRIRSILMNIFWKLRIVLRSPERTKHVYN